MADATVKLDMAAMVEKFKSLGPLMAPSVYVAMLVTAQKMLRDVVSQRMSNPRRGSTATNLGVDTGTARRSMIDAAGVTADKVFALIGSPEAHVKVHEEGFHGTQHVPAHTRRRLGKAKAYAIKTRAVVKRSAPTAAQRRAGPINVRAHTRKANIVAKHFIRDTIMAAKVPTEDRILKALVSAFVTGRVPTFGQVAK